MYAILRWIIFSVLLLLFIFILKKNNKLKKKTLIISVIVTIILAEISMYIPIENQFMYFHSADSAYKYINVYSSKYIIDGKNSDLVVGNNIDSDELLIIPKNENGWQVGLSKDIEIAVAVSDTCGLGISIYKPTNECYIFVHNADNEKMKIKDNHNFEFKFINNNITNSVGSYEYAAFVGEIDNNYRLTVNGNTYKLLKFNKGNKIYDMQLVEAQ